MRWKARALALKGLGNDPISPEFDTDQGIPVVNYGIRSGIRIGRAVNPLYLALYACKELGLEHVTGPIFVPRLKETESRDYVQRAVDWLTVNQKKCESYSVWECDFPWPPAHLEPPWRCALTEAFGALLLLQANRASDARLHLLSMLTDFKDGGLGYHTGDSLWFLEYPSNNPPLILNCMLHCLAILRECADRIRDDALKNGFDLAYKTLRRDIRMFDASFYTYYDSLRTPAEQKYHEIHVSLLRILYGRTRDPWLFSWIIRWTRYRRLYPFIEPVIFTRYLLRTALAV